MKVKSESEVAQSCPTLSDPMDCSPPGSSAHGSFQARVLYIKQVNNKGLLYSTGNATHHHVTTYNGKEPEKNVYICMYN